MKQQRMTKQKQLIMQIAQSHVDHPSADQLYLEVRAVDAHISRGTVYRNLEQLSDSGILLHVKLTGADRFDSRIDRHYHAICTECGAVCDVPLRYRDEMDERVMDETGFQVRRHRTIFEGLCPNCQAQTAADTAKQ